LFTKIVQGTTKPENETINKNLLRMELILTTNEKLEKTINEALDKAIARYLPFINQTTHKAYITKAELMKLTDWSSRTIQHLRDTRQIPFSQHGRKILYPYKEIVEFLEQNKIKPINYKHSKH
jgi:hypothetical protein